LPAPPPSSESADTLTLVTGANITISGIDSVIASTGGDTVTVLSTNGAYIEGGANDIITGSATTPTNPDQFVFTSTGESPTTGMDTINNFHIANDTLWFKGMGLTNFEYMGAGTSASSFAGGGNSSAYFDNANNVLYVDTTGGGSATMEIKLAGVQATGLHIANFITS
jgi:hypothetical protein